jgi:hypothetical protein
VPSAPESGRVAYDAGDAYHLALTLAGERARKMWSGMRCRYPLQGVADSHVEPVGIPAGGADESVIGREQNISATTFSTGDVQRIVASEAKSLNCLGPCHDFRIEEHVSSRHPDKARRGVSIL